MNINFVLKNIIVFLLAIIVFAIYYDLLYFLFPDFSLTIESTFIYALLPVSLAIIGSIVSYRKYIKKKQLFTDGPITN